MATLDLLVSGLTLGAIYSLVALGFHMVYKMTGIIDFAQGDKVVIGGLIGLTLVQHGMSTVVLVLLLVGLVGLVIGVIYDALVILPTQRNGTIAAVAATVGITLVFANGHQLIWGPNATPFPALAAGGVRLSSLRLSYQSLIVWVVSAVLAVSVSLMVSRTKTGQAMVAAATDPLAASAVGINVSRLRALAFALAFGLATVAGVLIAPITLAGGAVGTSLTLKGFTGAILGGLDSTHGVVIGSFLLGVIESLISGVLPNGDVEPVIFGGLIVLLLVLPQGLFGFRRRRLA